MRILQVHNMYQFRTGEETVVEQEKKILEANGHKVLQYIKKSSDIRGNSKLQKIKMLSSLRSNKKIAAELVRLIELEKPDICHVHNTFPLITPVVYQVCKENNVPVIQTLHNYKLLCTNSQLFRNGEICEVCLNKNLYKSIKYKCYRNSYIATTLQADVIQHHRNKGTWENSIDKYLCFTDFQKEKMVSGGIKSEKISVKPNFIYPIEKPTSCEDFFLFVGRIADYKGLDDLLYLFDQNRSSKFVLIGRADNPEILENYSNVTFMGEQDRDIAMDYMSKCKAVLFPSKNYEGMPMVILEAFSLKKPVICKDLGAMSSMIEDKSNGLKYQDKYDLVQKVSMLEADGKLVESLGKQAYNDFQENYSAQKGHENLIQIYSEVLSNNSSEQLA